MIKEVLHDPSVLEAADPELLLQITAGNFGAGDTDDDTECDVDLSALDLSKEKKPKKCSKSVQMELVSIKIKNTALQRQVEDLEHKVGVIKEEKRNLEDAKSKLNRDVAKYLNTARRNENRYLDIEEKLKENNLILFKRNKELNAARKELHTLSQRHAMCEHCEQIQIGNFDAVEQIERNVALSKNKEDQERYYRSMYQWILKEYKRSQSDRERDKMEHAATRKKLGEIHEDQRATIDQLKEMGAANLEKIDKYKKHYFDLKERYLNLKKRAKTIQQRNEEMKKTIDSRASNNGSSNMLHSEEDTVSATHSEHGDRYKEHHEMQSENVEAVQYGDDDLNSISREDYVEDQENITSNKEEEENENEDEDDDLKITNHHHSNIAMDSNRALNEGVFSIPNDGSMGFRRTTTSRSSGGSGANALFGAYRQMKHRKDGQHSFANHPNVSRKRKFPQFAKGSDGRGGTASFLTQNVNARNPRNKKRRVVKSSSSSNQNKNLKQTKKANIANYFQRNRK